MGLRIFFCENAQITVRSGTPSATPADVVYSIEPPIFLLNFLIETTFA
jgi:hypothetical protein